MENELSFIVVWFDAYIKRVRYRRFRNLNEAQEWKKLQMQKPFVQEIFVTQILEEN